MTASLPEKPIRPMWITYALLDPRFRKEGCVFYVGLTNDIRARYIAHIGLKEVNRQKNAIIEELLSVGMLPIPRTLEISFTEQQGRISERDWIKAFIDIGEPLTNVEATGRQR